MTVLEGPERLTAAFLSRVLSGPSGAVSVRTFEVAKIGTGQMGDTYRVALDADGDAPASIVGKFASPNQASRSIGLALRVYEVEVRFYQELAAKVASRTPRCFHADVDTTTGAFTLLLEDVRDAEVGDQLVGLDLDEMRAAISELAALHGATLDQPFAREASWLNRSTPEGESATRAMVASMVPGFLDRYSVSLRAEEVAVVVAVAGQAPPGSAPSSPRVAAHGDFRADNLLFAPDARPVVVDYQTMSWAHPALDLAYLLSSSLSVEDRRRSEHELIGHYLDELDARHGVRLDPAAFLAAYPTEARYGISMAVGASMLVDRTDRGDEMFLAHTRRHCAQLLDWGLQVDGTGV